MKAKTKKQFIECIKQDLEFLGSIKNIGGNYRHGRLTFNEKKELIDKILLDIEQLIEMCEKSYQNE